MAALRDILDAIMHRRIAAPVAGCSADRGDASVTLTPGVDAGTQIFNTALTAARTVTLATANAMDLIVWRIVRTANATGAFNLTVGGKALTAAGQWVDFQWDAATSAYIETAAGTL